MILLPAARTTSKGECSDSLAVTRRGVFKRLLEGLATAGVQLDCVAPEEGVDRSMTRKTTHRMNTRQRPRPSRLDHCSHRHQVQITIMPPKTNRVSNYKCGLIVEGKVTVKVRRLTADVEQRRCVTPRDGFERRWSRIGEDGAPCLPGPCRPSDDRSSHVPESGALAIGDRSLEAWISSVLESPRRARARGRSGGGGAAMRRRRRECPREDRRHTATTRPALDGRRGRSGLIPWAPHRRESDHCGTVRVERRGGGAVGGRRRGRRHAANAHRCGVGTCVARRNDNSWRE